MFISRLKSLIGGKFSRWLKAREAHDPEAVYEAAISDRIRRYGSSRTRPPARSTCATSSSAS